MITLAVLTGIPAEQWAKEGSRAIATGFEVIRELRGIKSTEDKQDSPQYSG